MKTPKPKPEPIAGAVPVVLTRSPHGWIVSWRRPVAQSLLLPTETLARTIATRIAGAENPINVLGKVLIHKERAKIGAKAGAASWAGRTPEERKARAQANARARWARVKGTPTQIAADGENV